MELVSACPPSFGVILSHISTLNFLTKPDYDLMIQALEVRSRTPIKVCVLTNENDSDIVRSALTRIWYWLPIPCDLTIRTIFFAWVSQRPFLTIGRSQCKWVCGSRWGCFFMCMS